MARWSWSSREPFLKDLLLSLKGEAPDWAYDEIVSLWLQAFPIAAMQAQEEGAFLVYPPHPVPVSMGQGLRRVFGLEPKDPPSLRRHAFYLAKAFARALGLQVLEGLLMDESLTRSDQKERNKEARKRERRYRVVETHELPFLENLPLIFVDDLLTTGSTAQATWEALGRPPHFRLWTLFYRSSLLNSPQIDRVQQSCIEERISSDKSDGWGAKPSC